MFFDKVLFLGVAVVISSHVVTLSFLCFDFGINLLYCNLQISVKKNVYAKLE